MIKSSSSVKIVALYFYRAAGISQQWRLYFIAFNRFLQGIPTAAATNRLPLFLLPLSAMESTRQLKSARLIQKEMAEIFLTESRGLFGNVMITVTLVRMSPDLGVAKVYVSLFPVKDKDTLLDLIREKTPELRRNLGNRIAKQVRVIPELIFFLDDSLDYAEHINELLKK